MNETTSANITPGTSSVPESEKKNHVPVQNRIYSQAIKQSPEFMNFQVDFAVCLNELTNYFNAIIMGNFKAPDALLEKTDYD